jgi:hypothetical protein
MKRTYKDLEKFHGVSRSQLAAARLAGVNIWNDEAAAAYLGTRRHRIKSGAELSTGESAAAQTLDEIEAAIRTATSIDDVKILREKVTALKTIIAVQSEMRNLISNHDVQNDVLECLEISFTEFEKLPPILSPLLAGLDEAQIAEVVAREINACLSRLAMGFTVDT